MTAMPTELLGLPRNRPLTRADLQRMPDDGHRYELIDGVLVVSPAPRWHHQQALGQLFLALHAACPDELELLFAPFAVALAEDTELQPDLLIAPRRQFTERELPGAPLLAVEVLSPSTRSFDLLNKKDRLRRAGCPHYWVVDPDEPSIVSWRLEGEEYVEAGRASGHETLALDLPFAVRIVPHDLVKD